MRIFFGLVGNMLIRSNFGGIWSAVLRIWVGALIRGGHLGLFEGG
jgi:hypothetical protein